MTTKLSFSFNPKQVAKRLLKTVPDRAQDILSKRYGLGEKTERMTLESIGQLYGITRERVRQIE
jgi:RNA polymerase primary sigma factor